MVFPRFVVIRKTRWASNQCLRNFREYGQSAFAEPAKILAIGRQGSTLASLLLGAPADVTSAAQSTGAETTGATLPATLPGFRASCLTISGVFVVIAGSLLARGPATAMAEYGVPPETLASPHYADAIFWVFLHMTVIGAIIGVVGWFAEGVRMQRAFVRLMLAAQAVYTMLDVRAADWFLGTALYRGPGSLGPVVVGALAFTLLLRLNLVRARPVVASK